MKTRTEIKLTAKNAMRNQYGPLIGAYLLTLLIAGTVIPATFGVGALLVLLPLTVGYSYYTLCVYRGQQPTLNTLFQSGFYYYGHTLGGMLWMSLFIYLWSLLLVIPGIVKSFAYSMTPYLLADHPKLPPTEALKISMRMTQGYKADLFIMVMSFLGWYLLSLLTFGLLSLFYVDPYLHISYAGMYEQLKANALARGVIRWEELNPV